MTYLVHLNSRAVRQCKCEGRASPHGSKGKKSECTTKTISVVGSFVAEMSFGKATGWQTSSRSRKVRKPSNCMTC